MEEMWKLVVFFAFFEVEKKWIYPKARLRRASGSRKLKWKKGNIPQGAPSARLFTA